eukprot:m.11649 g.11649  ORF g.11649 m.11649 type:complete len:589 (+) comp4498_c0_seq1:258-2024(+)
MFSIWFIFLLVTLVAGHSCACSLGSNENWRMDQTAAWTDAFGNHCDVNFCLRVPSSTTNSWRIDVKFPASVSSVLCYDCSVTGSGTAYRITNVQHNRAQTTSSTLPFKMQFKDHSAVGKCLSLVELKWEGKQVPQYKTVLTVTTTTKTTTTRTTTKTETTKTTTKTVTVRTFTSKTMPMTATTKTISSKTFTSKTMTMTTKIITTSETSSTLTKSTPIVSSLSTSEAVYTGSQSISTSTTRASSSSKLPTSILSATLSSDITATVSHTTTQNITKVFSLDSGSTTLIPNSQSSSLKSTTPEYENSATSTPFSIATITTNVKIDDKKESSSNLVVIIIAIIVVVFACVVIALFVVKRRSGQDDNVSALTSNPTYSVKNFEETEDYLTPVMGSQEQQYYTQPVVMGIGDHYYTDAEDRPEVYANSSEYGNTSGQQRYYTQPVAVGTGEHYYTDAEDSSEVYANSDMGYDNASTQQRYYTQPVPVGELEQWYSETGQDGVYDNTVYTSSMVSSRSNASQIQKMNSGVKDTDVMYSEASSNSNIVYDSASPVIETVLYDSAASGSNQPKLYQSHLNYTDLNVPDQFGSFEDC